MQVKRHKMSNSQGYWMIIFCIVVYVILFISVKINSYYTWIRHLIYITLISFCKITLTNLKFQNISIREVTWILWHAFYMFRCKIESAQESKSAHFIIITLPPNSRNILPEGVVSHQIEIKKKVCWLLVEYLVEYQSINYIYTSYQTNAKFKLSITDHYDMTLIQPNCW